MLTIQDFPHINAGLNASSTVLLVIGFVLIKQRRYRSHAVMMILASLVSAAFLACYLIYHYKEGEKSTGHMTWLPTWLRTIYLLILFPHLLLAFFMLPMIVITLYRAYRRQWDKHRRIARPTFYIWLYVSVTGVIIYWMLYHLFPSMKG
jgi:putative membrane protein